MQITASRCRNLNRFSGYGGTGVDDGADGGSEARFAAYVEQLGRVLGHADRREPLHDYCLGLVMPIERKSVEPMAALTAGAGGSKAPISCVSPIGSATVVRQ